MSRGGGGAPTRRTPSGRRATALAIAATTAGVLPVWLTGGMAVLIREDMALDDRRLGFAVAAFFLASAVASVPGGRIAERVGARRSLLAGTTGTVGALALLATATTGADGLTATLFLAGLANGVVYPAVNMVIAELVTSRRGLAFGIKQSAIPTATLLAGAALPLLGDRLGWRSAFAGAAVVVVAVAGGVWHQLPSPGARPAGRPAAARGRPGRAMLLITCAAALGSGAGNALAAFAVPSAVRTGLSTQAAGRALVLASALCIATRVAVGWWADRGPGRHLRTIGVMLLLGGAALTTLAWGGAPTAVLVAATALAFAAGWGWAGLMNLSVVDAHPTSPAAATGVLQVGVYGGAVAGPAAFGAIAVATSYALAWSVLAVAATSAALLLLGLDRRTAGAPAPVGGSSRGA